MTYAPAVTLREYRATDREQLLRLLSFLPEIYPGAEAWLEKKLAELLVGRAGCRWLSTKAALSVA